MGLPASDFEVTGQSHYRKSTLQNKTVAELIKNTSRATPRPAECCTSPSQMVLSHATVLLPPSSRPSFPHTNLPHNNNKNPM